MTSEFTHLTSDVIQASSSPSSRADLRESLSAGREEVVAEPLVIPGLPGLVPPVCRGEGQGEANYISFRSLGPSVALFLLVTPASPVNSAQL